MSCMPQRQELWPTASFEVKLALFMIPYKVNRAATGTWVPVFFAARWTTPGIQTYLPPPMVAVVDMFGTHFSNLCNIYQIVMSRLKYRLSIHH